MYLYRRINGELAEEAGIVSSKISQYQVNDRDKSVMKKVVQKTYGRTQTTKRRLFTRPSMKTVSIVVPVKMPGSEGQKSLHPFAYCLQLLDSYHCGLRIFYDLFLIVLDYLFDRSIKGIDLSWSAFSNSLLVVNTDPVLFTHLSHCHTYFRLS